MEGRPGNDPATRARGRRIAARRAVRAATALLVLAPMAAPADAVETLAARIDEVSVRHEPPWLSIRYRWRNTTGRSIGSGELRCVAYGAGGEPIGHGRVPVAGAGEPGASQEGLILIALEDATPVRHHCTLEVGYWLVDGRWVRAEPYPEAPPADAAPDPPGPS